MPKYNVGDSFLEVNPLQSQEDYFIEVLFISPIPNSDSQYIYFVKETIMKNGIETGYLFNIMEERWIENLYIVKKIRGVI
jgi:hypothetical protein